MSILPQCIVWNDVMDHMVPIVTSKWVNVHIFYRKFERSKSFKGVLSHRSVYSDKVNSLPLKRKDSNLKLSSRSIFVCGKTLKLIYVKT